MAVYCLLVLCNFKVTCTNLCVKIGDMHTFFDLVYQYKIAHTGQPLYVKLAYLKYTAYVEVIIHSRAFPLYCFVFQTCLCRT